MYFKTGVAQLIFNQPDGLGPEGPLPHLEGAAGRDRTRVTPDEGCRSAKFNSGRLCTLLRVYGAPPVRVFNHGLKDMHRFSLKR